MTALERLKLRLPDETNEDLLIDIIETSKAVILAKRFPYGTDRNEIDPQYNDLLFRIALDLYNKQGAEGEISHSENGVSRTYQSSWVSSDLLDEIVPYGSIL